MFYEAPLLKPYVFFDVAAGREAGGGGGSRSKTNRVSHLMLSVLLERMCVCDDA